MFINILRQSSLNNKNSKSPREKLSGLESLVLGIVTSIKAFKLWMFEILMLSVQVKVFYLEQRYSWWRLRRNVPSSLWCYKKICSNVGSLSNVKLGPRITPFIFFFSPLVTLKSFHQIANWSQVMFVSELSEEAVYFSRQFSCVMKWDVEKAASHQWTNNA